LSLKLYHSFKFKSPDLFAIHKAIMEWRAELRLLHIKASAQDHALFAVSIIDEEAVHPGRHSGESPMIKAWLQVSEFREKFKAAGLLGATVDFGFTLSIFPHETGVYGRVYTERQDWRVRWMDKDFIEDFSFWTNTDCPAEVTPQEWAHREEVWHDILGQAAGRSESMVSFIAECTHDDILPHSDDLVVAAPSFEKRVAKQARVIVTAEEKVRRIERAGTESSQSDREIAGRRVQVVGISGGESRDGGGLGSRRTAVEARPRSG
jgi:hypothetical protein